MTSQIRAESAASAEPTARTDQAASPDAWDRLAALAFDRTPAHGGCSAQAHECTCRAEHAHERGTGHGDDIDRQEGSDDPRHDLPATGDSAF